MFNRPYLMICFEIVQAASRLMAGSASFLIVLADAVSRGSPESCLRAIWHATDVLITSTYSKDQIWTFGEITPVSGAPHYRVTAGDLDRLKLDFYRLNVKTSRNAITLYRSRKDDAGGSPFQRSYTTLL